MKKIEKQLRGYFAGMHLIAEQTIMLKKWSQDFMDFISHKGLMNEFFEWQMERDMEKGKGKK